MEYEYMSNEQLEKEYDTLWLRYMYFMAAEGNWETERKFRELNDKKFDALKAEMEKRNLEF